MTVAEVRLHGKRVGELRFARGGSSFHYEDDLADPAHLTLGQTFEDDPRRVRRTRIGVPPWFANLLPEGALRRQIIREMGGGNIGNFTLLLRLGEYLPGAVSVHADAEPVGDRAPEQPSHEADHPFRHSLAGVQLKYSVSGDRLVLPVSGAGGWWIVKLPDRSLRDLPLNEYLTMRWLAAAGLNVPPVHLLPAGSVQGVPMGLVAPDDEVYVIRRFDRSPDGPVHVEDFAQVADVEPMFKYSESGASYDALGAIVRQLVGTQGFEDFVGRIVAMILVGNTDAHLKNWAFIYPDGREPALAPVYDFHSLTVYSNYRYAPLALSIAGEKMPPSVQLDHFRRLAEHAGADPEHTVEVVARTVQRLRDAWSGDVRAEAVARFEALAADFERRLATLPIAAS